MDKNVHIIFFDHVLKSSEMGCPVYAFQRMISGKYKLRIVWDLKDGPLRFSEIRRSLVLGATPGMEIAPRVMSRELKALTDLGVLCRNDFQTVPPKVEYGLTELGKSLIPLIAEMHQWAVSSGFPQN